MTRECPWRRGWRDSLLVSLGTSPRGADVTIAGGRGARAGTAGLPRGKMIREMVQAGHEVVAMAPEDDPSVREALERLVASYLSTGMQRTGMNPVHDLRAMRALTATFRSLDLDSCLVYSGKAVIYGSMAARLAGIPSRAAMITGAGSGLVGGAGWKRRALASLLRTLYAVALRQTQIVFFQNPDDERLFVQAGMVSRRQRRVRINGSGVDLTEFAAAPLPTGRRPSCSSPASFARRASSSMWRLHVDSGRAMRGSRSSGHWTRTPPRSTEDEVAAWQERGVVEYLGETDDVRPFIRQAHVCVLPSYYGEGVPRSLLEGLAIGRPIVTTDMPGCRETVVDGHNGYRSPALGPVALADAMARLIERPDEIGRMATASRELAADRFDVRKVNRVILDAMGLRPGPMSSA